MIVFLDNTFSLSDVYSKSINKLKLYEILFIYIVIKFFVLL